MLTDTKIKQAKPADKMYKLYDELGLYLEILPTGHKRWCWKYRFAGKEKLLRFRSYPVVTLKMARDERDAALKILAQGKDPSVERKEWKMQAAQEVTFGRMAEEYQTAFSRVWSKSHQGNVRQRLDAYILPFLGKRPVNAITPTDVLAFVRDIEKKGAFETASRVLGICGQVFRYAVSGGHALSDPCRDLRGALVPTVVKKRAALTTEEGARAVMRAIDGYMGSFIVRCAVRFTALTFVRQGELRYATWPEIDFDKALWSIPAARMKGRLEHMVPLSRQSLELLRELYQLTGASDWVFPSLRHGNRPISENTVNSALRAMGFGKDEMCAHGFRAMASTLLNEQGWRPDVIERQLAHVERNKVRGAYNRAEYLSERVRMMQAWADYLDGLLLG